MHGSVREPLRVPRGRRWASPLDTGSRPAGRAERMRAEPWSSGIATRPCRCPEHFGFLNCRAFLSEPGCVSLEGASGMGRSRMEHVLGAGGHRARRRPDGPGRAAISAFRGLSPAGPCRGAEGRPTRRGGLPVGRDEAPVPPPYRAGTCGVARPLWADRSRHPAERRDSSAGKRSAPHLSTRRAGCRRGAWVSLPGRGRPSGGMCPVSPCQIPASSAQAMCAGCPGRGRGARISSPGRGRGRGGRCGSRPARSPPPAPRPCAPGVPGPPAGPGRAARRRCGRR